MRQPPTPDRRARLPVLILALVYLGAGIAYIAVTPRLEKSDEQGHYGYVLYLRQHRALPPLEVTDALSFEFKQPPLYYVLVGGATTGLPDEPYTLPRTNPYIELAAPGVRGDNRNVYLHPPDHTPIGRVGRGVSLLFGLGTVLVTYQLAREVLPTAPVVPMAAAATVGFHPRFLFMATALNNDAAAACFGALLSWLFVRRLRRGPSWRATALTGVVLGLAILVKTSAVLFFPLLALTLLLCPGEPWQRRAREGLRIVALAVGVGGWWYLRNLLTFGDALTLQAHLGGATAGRALGERWLSDLRGIEYTFWGNLARPTVAPLPLDWALIWWGRVSTLILALSLARALLRGRRDPAPLILASVPAAYLVALLGFWNTSQAFTFGRLLFPGLAALVVLWLWGWHTLMPAPGRRPALLIGAGMVMTLGIFTPLVSIHPLYHPYRAIEPDPGEQRGAYVYRDAAGTAIAELIGYELLTTPVTPGDYAVIRLCWRPRARTATPYAVFVHLLDASQLDRPTGPSMLGARRTYPGLGNRPTDRWPRHAAFCDPVGVPTDPDVALPTQTLAEVGLIDPQHDRRLHATDPQGAAVVPTVAGPAIVPSRHLDAAPPPMAYLLDQRLALSPIEIERAPGHLALTLVWHTRRPVDYDAVVFAHVLDADGTLVTQADRMPLDGRFPTSAWVPDMVLTDTLELSVPVAYTGPLRLRLGMYRWPSLERLPITDQRGVLQNDGTILQWIHQEDR